MPDSPSPRRPRWSALPRLLAAAPPRVVFIAGILLAILGVLIVSRPLTSLVLLGVYVAASALISGVLGLITAGERPLFNRIVGGAWIVFGIVILVWLGRSIELLPPVLAALLIVGGLASVGDALSRGRVSERVLAVAWGGAQLVFGILSLAWPDLTLLGVALAFGVRTIVFGISLTIRGARGMRTRRRIEQHRPPRVPSRRARTVVAVGRYGLATLLVAVSVGGWWVNDWLREGAPVIDAFYDAPEELPAGHGRLLRADDYLGRWPANGEVRRILYTTLDSASRPVAASAMVITPTEVPPGPRPVVIWNHGTTGVAQGCAPSLTDATATRWAIPALDRALERGWIVVAPDYPGQGAAGDFPYLIGLGEGRAALDSVLAAEQLPDLTLSPRTAVWGHSQGGHAALWASQIAADYTPGLDVRGTVAISPAADPLALAGDLTTGRSNALLSILISWVLVPYADRYPDIEVDDYVATGAEPIVREMTARCLSEPGLMVSALTALGVSEDTPLYVGPLTVGPLADRLRQNVPTGPWDAPLLMLWGRDDDVIPPSAQEDFVARLCEQGERVRWSSYGATGHQDIVQPISNAPNQVLRFTAEMLEPEASVVPYPVDDCGRGWLPVT